MTAKNAPYFQKNQTTNRVGGVFSPDAKRWRKNTDGAETGARG